MTARVEAAGTDAAGFKGEIPAVEPLLAEMMTTLALVAHTYLTDTDGRQPDFASAEVAIDVATSAFERVKERLRPEERLAMAQMLTETRMTFVRKRGM